MREKGDVNTFTKESWLKIDDEKIMYDINSDQFVSLMIVVRFLCMLYTSCDKLYEFTNTHPQT